MAKYYKRPEKPAIPEEAQSPKGEGVEVLRRLMLSTGDYNGDKIVEAGVIIPAAILTAEETRKLLASGAIRKTTKAISSEMEIAARRKAAHVRMRTERKTT
jgi:hypothetical protein